MNALKLNDLFRGTRIPQGLAVFEDDPVGGLHDLLVGRAALGSLSPVEPTQLLLGWLESLGEPFVDTVNRALALWIEKYWGETLLPRSAESLELSADAWCRAFEILANDRRLSAGLAVLRERMPAGRNFLSLMRSGRSRDPEGRAWLALARYQEDRSLLPVWWRLVRLPSDVPWYHGGYGIRGLRGLPEERPGSGGGFPAEAAEGLVVLAEALENRYREGWLEEAVAEGEFLRLARTTMWGYNLPDRWLRFWRQTLPAEGIGDELHHGWIRQLFPQKLRDFTAPAARDRGTRGQRLEPDIDWHLEAGRIAKNLELDRPRAVDEAEALLGDQRFYAEKTGEVHFFVRSACNFARAARSSRPEKALEWVRLSRSNDPDNPYPWNTESQILLDLSRVHEARWLALEAVRRFPYNPVAHSTFGKVLLQQERLVEAEAVYREAAERFPRDPVVKIELAEILKREGRLDETQEFYEKARDIDESDALASRELRRLRERGQLLESEVAEPPAVYDVRASEGPDLDPVEILLQDAYLIRRWARRFREQLPPGEWRRRVRQVLEQLAAVPANRPDVIAERGLLSLEAEELDAALDFLREAARRHPQSVQVQYALARAERAASRRDDEISPESLRPWGQLARQSEHLRAVQLLGCGRTHLQRNDPESEEKAREFLGELGWRVQKILESHAEEANGGETSESCPFLVTWAEKVREHSFGGKAVVGVEDLPPVEELRRLSERNAAELDLEEESLTYRASAA